MLARNPRLVAKVPGRDRVRLIFTRSTSVSVAGRVVTSSSYSRMISCMLSIVLSVCTVPRTMKYWSPLVLGPDGGTDAVGPVLVFAKIHVDTRLEGAAEQVVHDREFCGGYRVERRDRMAGDNGALLRPGLVDQDHAPCRRRRIADRQRAGPALGAPLAERAIDELDGFTMSMSPIMNTVMLSGAISRAWNSASMSRSTCLTSSGVHTAPIGCSVP